MTEWTLSRDNQNLIYKITFHQGAIFNQIYPGFIKGADQLNSEEVGRGCGQEPMGSGMGDFRKNFLQTDFEGKIILQGNTLPWWLFMSGKKFYHQRLQRFGKKNSCPNQIIHIPRQKSKLSAPKQNQVRFRRRTFHEPNLIRIKPTQIIKTGWIDSDADLDCSWTKLKRRKMLISVKPACKYVILIYALGSVHEKFGVWIKAVP